MVAVLKEATGASCILESAEPDQGLLVFHPQADCGQESWSIPSRRDALVALINDSDALPRQPAPSDTGELEADAAGPGDSDPGPIRSSFADSVTQ